jgi:hypothetical protein
MQPSLSTRRGRLLAKCLVIVLVVAASVAIFASPAAAYKPAKTEGTWEGDFVLTDVCSFEVGVHAIQEFTEIDFVDASGALTRIYYRAVEQDTFTANEKKLVGIPFTFNVEVLFDSGGNVTHNFADGIVESGGNVTHNFADGIVEKVPLPDGSLFVSAGRLDWVNHPGAAFLLSPDKGNPGNVAAFCAALAP